MYNSNKTEKRQLNNINTVFVARHNEKSQILNDFDSVLKGLGTVTFVSGVAGIGKTFLVNKIVSDLKHNKITYAEGKYRYYDNEPLLALSEVLDIISKHLLTLPNNYLVKVKNELIKEIGDNINIITAISPYSRKILDSNSEINIKSASGIKLKVKKAILQFLQVTSNALFPLIIFIDDIQWADSFSLSVIQYLINNIAKLNIMLLISYRSNEFNIEKLNLKYSSKLQQYLKNIELKEINLVDLLSYFKQLYQNNIEHVDYLARFTYSITLGNPFFIKEIIDVYLQEGVLYYDDDSLTWKVNVNNINKLTFSTNIKDIISRKISKLQENEKEILNIILCLDGLANYEILSQIINEHDINTSLTNLLNSAIIINKDNQYIISHDILSDITYNRLTEDYISNLHYKIATSLYNSSLKNKYSQLIVSQVLRSNPELYKNNSNAWIEYIYNSQINSLSSVTLEQFTKVFEYIMLLIPYSENLETDLVLEIELHLVECLLVNNKYVEAENKLNNLLIQTKSINHTISVMQKLMIMYGYKGEFINELNTGKEILNLLSFELDIKNYQKDLILAKQLFCDEFLSNVYKQQQISNNSIALVIETLAKMTPSANCVDQGLFNYILLKIGILSAEYGYSPYTPIGYGAYSFILYNNLQDYEKGEKLLQISLSLLERNEDTEIISFVYTFVGTFIKHWTQPLKNSIYYLEKGIKENIKSGKFIYGGYAIVSIMYAKYAMGNAFSEIKNYVDNLLESFYVAGDGNSLFVNDLFINYLTFLETGTLNKEYSEIESIASKNVDSIGLIYFIFESHRLYLCQNYNAAYILAQKYKTMLEFLRGHIIYPHLIFMLAIIKLSYHNKLNERDKEKNKNEIKAYISDLKLYTKLNNENYARYQIVEAFYLINEGTQSNIDKILYFATQHAEQNKQYHIAAIGNLITAELYSYNTKLKHMYAKEAIKSYNSWGAFYIADLVEKNYGINQGLNNIVNNTNENVSITNKDDFQSYLQQLQLLEELSEVDSSLHLLDFLNCNTRVNYSGILLEKDDDMFLHYSKENTDNSISYPFPQRLNHTSLISHNIVRYVARTAEDVIVNSENISKYYFIDESSFSKNKCVLCLPILYQEVMIGVIYLQSSENCFNHNLVQFIKTAIQVIVFKMQTLKNINMKEIFVSSTIDTDLTTREIEVLNLVANGLTNTAISKDLQISLGTVKTHLSNIYSKLDVDSRIKAVLRASELKIVKIS